MKHGIRRGVVGTLAGALLAGGFTMAAAPAATAAPRDPDRPSYLGKKLYTGEFHSHTSVSDGVKLPEDAFDHVRNETQADFFTASEHDVMWDLRNGDDFIDDWRDADSEEWRYLHEAAEKFNAKQEDLLAIPSIENTWYDGTGHINVFNADWKATARATQKGTADGFNNSFGTGDMKYDMYTFFARLKQDPDAIAQFNHPGATSKGNFFNFNGLDRAVDDKMQLIEVRSPGQVAEYSRALDTGWHVSPVWNGDEHSASWVSGNQAITGVWAAGRTLTDIYKAMDARSTFSTQDVNAQLAFGANGKMMGSILPADTGEIDFDLELTDPDVKDSFTKVELVSNGGQVVHNFPDITGGHLELAHQRDVADGDYYFVRATQADGHVVVSAPIWIGETTRGANYAPQITVPDEFAKTASYGDTIPLPQVTATDDSGATPQISFEVYDSTGQVQVEDNAFKVSGYDDQFVVVKAKDAAGNIGSELLRITVKQDKLDPEGVFQYFGSTATVTQKAGGAGLAVSTDRSINKVFAQVLPAGEDDWSKAEVLTSTNDKAYEANAIGNDEPVYQHSITGQTLRSHEFDLAGLKDGDKYQYRFGVADGQSKPGATAEDAWTEVQGEFVAGGSGNEPIYAIGDLQATSHDPQDLKMLPQVLSKLQEKVPGGRTLLQTGDLVDNGGRGQYWQEVFDQVFKDLDVQYAPVAGNHETYGDLDYNSLSEERTAIFGNMFNTPKNGAIGESNYSFNRGDVHVSVLNSVHDMDKQIDWLAKDIRSSDRKWNVVTGHYSYYGGSHGSDGPLAADRPKLTAAFDKLGVDVYIGGHDHIYKRSTIYDGRLAKTPEEEAAGTTFVTLGSAGPKFYDNVEYWWDDVVFDENTQVGSVLEATDDGLKINTWTIDGEQVDSYTVRKPQGSWRVTSTDVENRELAGIGVLSTEGTPASATMVAATYDSTGEKMRDIRTVDVQLDHQGSEQFMTFDSPLPVNPSDTLKVFAWDSLSSGKPLLDPIVAREGIGGDGTSADPYRITSAADLDKISNDPAGHYLLTKDLDLSGQTRTQLDSLETFRGVFDGGGHTVKGFTTAPDSGVGLFADNYGTIRNLTVEGNVETTRGTVGLLADTNHGLIERVRTGGSITGETRVGGIVGDHYGTVRDSYSTADVTTTGMYAGGVVAIAMGESVTDRVYSTGVVKGLGRNAGGVVSYGYENTHVTDSVALNVLVQGPSFAHAIVGRVADGQIADLQRNYTSSGTSVIGESFTEPAAADNWKGGVIRNADLRTPGFFGELGWNLDEVWQWHAKAKRPVLRQAPESIDDSTVAPTLDQAEDGFWLLKKSDDLQQIAAFPEEPYRLTVDLDLQGVDMPQLSGIRPFLGILDGAGHEIKNWKSDKGGLFGLIGAEGKVYDLGISNVDITSTGSRAGALANSLRGTAERIWTSGQVAAKDYAGGLVGDSFGTIRDVYSTAEITTTGGNYAGGIIGVADSPSLTERVYATGIVKASGTSAGGIAGYARNSGVVVKQAFALNPAVTGTTTSQRVVARSANGEMATLSALFAVDTMIATVQTVPAVGPTTFNGASRTSAQATDEATWRTDLGFDLTDVWQWSVKAKRPVLKQATEDAPEPPGPTAARDTDGAWLVASVAELRKLAVFPTETFRLAVDLDLAGTEVRIESFNGSLDGAGHSIKGLRSVRGGLFGTLGVDSQVTDLGLTDVQIDKTTTKAGALADTLRGTVERVWTTGRVTVHSTGGGLAGDSFGTIRDSYSTVDVTTTTADYAGGIVGIADSPSLIERVYATGRVVAAKQSAGGLAGYARNNMTVVRKGVVLSPVVTATVNGNRVIARFATGQTAALSDLFASNAVVASVQGSTATGANTVNGETKTVEELALPETWSAIGFDLESAWSWDASQGLPVLVAPVAGRSTDAQNSVFTGAGTATAVTAVATVRTAAAESPSHTVQVDGEGRTTLSLAMGADAGAERAGVLVLRPGADPRQVKIADIEYLGQPVLDERGAASLTFRIVDLSAGNRLAVGFAGQQPRYLAKLDPQAAADPVTLSAKEVTVVVGAEVRLEAQLGAGGSTPTGRITFTRAGSELGKVEVDAEGRAVLVLSARALAVGTHRITASYSGDEFHAAASKDLTVTVNSTQGAKATISAKALSLSWGARGTLDVRAAGATGQPTGTVSVLSGNKSLGSAKLVGGKARITLGARTLRVGSHQLRLVYSGDRMHSAATASVRVQVRKAASSVRVTKVSPSKIRAKRHNTVLWIKVSVPSGVKVNGTVTVRGSGISTRTVRVVNGKARIKLGKIKRSGTKKLTVRYSGSSDVSGSSRTVKLKIRR